jgi:hypothetical protein
MCYMATGERIRLTATLLPKEFSAPEDIDPGSYTLGRISPVNTRSGNKHQTETEREEMQRTRLGYKPGPPESTQRECL